MPSDPKLPSLPLARAAADLFWTFFPVFVLVLILGLLGRLGHLTERTDLIMCAAVLFAEGWAKLRRALVYRRSSLEFIGFLGALTTVILVSMMLLVEAGSITQLQPVVTSTRFAVVHNILLAASVLYGFAVRAKVFYREDLDKEMLRHAMDRRAA